MKRTPDTQKRIRAQYADPVSSDASPTASLGPRHDSAAYAKSIGYSQKEIKSVPAGAAVTHGCGNPTAIAELKAGETVLDLGCGGGLDAFLAAQKVGPKGRSISMPLSWQDSRPLPSLPRGYSHCPKRTKCSKAGLSAYRSER